MSLSPRAVSGCVALLAVVSLGASIWRPSAHVTEQAPPPAAAGPDDLSRKLDVVNKRFEAMEGEIDDLYSNIERAVPPTDDLAQAEAAERSASTAPSPPEVTVDDVRAQFAHEQRDTAWATKAEQLLEVGLSAANGVNVREIRCAGTLCRVAFEGHPDGISDTESINSLTQAVPWDANGMITQDGPSPKDMVLFVFREGYQPAHG